MKAEMEAWQEGAHGRWGAEEQQCPGGLREQLLSGVDEQENSPACLALAGPEGAPSEPRV